MKISTIGLANELPGSYNEPIAATVVDAIIVPTVRSTDHVLFAAGLARETGAYLLALCSGSSSAAMINAFLYSTRTEGTALDIPPGYINELLTGFSTDTFAEAAYGRKDNDISLKRNLTLILARLVGWGAVCFLDDDIYGLSGKDVGQAASIMTGYSTVCFRVTDFPDNSVVRHAQRLSGTEPGVQMSGGASIINLAKDTRGFFPAIYNEDWFFLQDRLPTLFAPASAQQLPYDPFRNPLRAASEELGDILAEGIVQMKMAGLDCENAGKADWGDILAKRRQLLSDINSSLEAGDIPEFEREKSLQALAVAQARHSEITAAVCRDYIRAWRQDAALWQNRLGQLPGYLSMTEALRELKLTV